MTYGLAPSQEWGSLEELYALKAREEADGEFNGHYSQGEQLFQVAPTLADAKKLGQAFLGRDPTSAADIQPIMNGINQALSQQPLGSPDPFTGRFSHQPSTPWYQNPGVLIPALALGGTAAGAAGLFGGAAGGATAGAAPATAEAVNAAFGTGAGGATGASVAPEFSLAGGATGYGTSGTAAIPGAAGGIGGAGTGIMAGAAGAGSLIPGIPNNVAAGIGQGVLGYLGAGKVSDAYQNVANQNLAIGQPFRSKLEQSYAPGFDLWSQPGYSDALQHTADASARAANVTYGNPYDASAQTNIQHNVMAGTVLPALANYRGQLGQFGGLGLNTAGAAQLGGAGAAGGGLDAIGYGLGTVFSPKPDLTDILRQLRGPQQPGLSLNIGGNLFK